MKYLAALVLGLAACAARAEAPDLKTYTCGAYLHFVVSNMGGDDAKAKASVSVQMAWIYGYLAGLHEATRLDAPRFSAVMRELGKRCEAHPEALVLAQAQEAWEHPAAPAPAGP
jgi:hypothetical protein